MTRCRGKTKAGDRCRAEGSEGAEYCWRHVPSDGGVDEGILDDGVRPEFSDRMMTIGGLMMVAALVVFGIRKIS